MGLQIFEWERRSGKSTEAIKDFIRDPDAYLAVPNLNMKCIAEKKVRNHFTWDTMSPSHEYCKLKIGMIITFSDIIQDHGRKIFLPDVKEIIIDEAFLENPITTARVFYTLGKAGINVRAYGTNQQF
ncbi:hypothetical protein D1872_81350 [compost metagenome]